MPRNKWFYTWLAVPILVVIVLAVHLSQHPLYQTFQCDKAQTANRIVLLEEGTELELRREEDAGLFERVLHALFDVRYRRSGRSDNASHDAVRLSILDASGTVLWERFVCGDLVVDRGYFYRRTGGEESLDDLIAQIKARAAAQEPAGPGEESRVDAPSSPAPTAQRAPKTEADASAAAPAVTAAPQQYGPPEIVYMERTGKPYEQYDHNTDGRLQSVEFPRAGAEIFKIPEKYAALYDYWAQRTYDQTFPDVQNTTCLIPQMTVYGEYTDDRGNTVFLGTFGMYQWVGLGDRPEDIPERVYSMGRQVSRDGGQRWEFLGPFWNFYAIAMDQESRVTACTLGTYEGGSEGGYDWRPDLIRTLCGPLSELAAAWIQGPIDELEPLFQMEDGVTLLWEYIDSFFAG